MNSKRMLLLKTLLKSTSMRNRIAHSSDKKIRNKAIGGFVGLLCLYALIGVYSLLLCVGYGSIGIAGGIPVICAAVVSVVAFFLTTFKTNGYLFHFKEYDMLMSLPFEERTVAADKFLYMYLKGLPWYLTISYAMMVGYGIYEKPSFLVYPVWMILSLFLPVIPMLFATFIGFLIAKISSGFQKKNLIQTTLTFLFVLFCFSLQYIIEAIVKNENSKQVFADISEAIEGIGNWYFPIRWFAKAVREIRVSDILLLTGLSILLFEAVFFIVGKNYRQINSALKSHAAAKKYQMTAQKKNSVIQAIAFKEWKRMTGSTVYMVNASVGEIISLVLGIVVLVVGFKPMLMVVLKGAPVSAEVIFPAIPLIVYFFVGMVATTACSPSLEGKNYWILQSLPIEKKAIYQGKMLFNLYLTVPFALFATICFCISGKVTFLDTLIYLAEAVVLCLFSTSWGCVCGIRFRKLAWENEVEVVKQGAAITVYLLTNMLATMGLVALTIFLGMKTEPKLVSLILIAVVAVLAIVCYFSALSLGEKKD